jgi:hypothetical protein
MSTEEKAVDELLEAAEELTDGAKTLQAANVLPFHAATSHSPRNKAKALDMRPGAVQKRKEEEEAKAKGAKRQRGRPKKVEKKPDVEDLRYHQETIKREVGFVDADAVVHATNDRKDSAEVLHLLKTRIARAAASLEFQRIEMQKYGRDTGQVTGRQIAALKDIANIELKIRELGSQMIDLRAEPVQRVFAMFITKLQEAAKDVLPEAQFDLLFNKLETELDGWEDEAESLLR